MTAATLNNTLKGRKNISFVSRENGRIVGYIFAYEGSYEGKPCIYIADLSFDPEYQKTRQAGRLIHDWITTISTDDHLASLHIVTYARSTTSAPLLAKHAPRYGYRLSNIDE